MYTGEIELTNQSGENLLGLLFTSDELRLENLFNHIQDYLIKHQAEFLHQNPSCILETVYQHDTFADLWNFYLEINLPNQYLACFSHPPSDKDRYDIFFEL